MTIGRISNMNYIAATGRVLSPAMRYNTQGTAPAAAPDTNSAQGKNNMFFSLDGDRVDISNRARDLSNLDPNQRPVGPGIVNNYPFDLPSTMIDWSKYDFRPAFSPSDTATPANMPNTGVPAGVPSGTPESGPSGALLPDSVNNSLLEALEPQGSCYTCENRKYVDQSNDASVSFQTPTNISPNMAAAAVASHENEHVRNEQARAHRDGREIINQTVTLTYDCCPECGRNYVSGGTTRTTSVSKSDSDNAFSEEAQAGENDNKVAVL